MYDKDDTNYGMDPRLSVQDRVLANREDNDTEISPLFGGGTTLALLVWGIVVMLFTGGIAGSTVFWPLLPIIGAAAPLAFAALAIWHAKNQQEALQGPSPGREVYAALASGDGEEREILGALLQNGGLSPALTAAYTSLSVTRADEILERMAGKGHLKVRALEGNLVYSLQGTGDPTSQDGETATS